MKFLHSFAVWVHRSKFSPMKPSNRPVWVCHRQICRHADHLPSKSRRRTNGLAHRAHIWIKWNCRDAPSAVRNENRAVTMSTFMAVWVAAVRTRPQTYPNRSKRSVFVALILNWMHRCVELARWARPTVSMAREQIWVPLAHAIAPWNKNPIALANGLVRYVTEAFKCINMDT